MIKDGVHEFQPIKPVFCFSMECRTLGVHASASAVYAPCLHWRTKLFGRGEGANFFVCDSLHASLSVVGSLPQIPANLFNSGDSSDFDWIVGLFGIVFDFDLSALFTAYQLSWPALKTDQLCTTNITHFIDVFIVKIETFEICSNAD